MATDRPHHRLQPLFAAHAVVELVTIRKALGGVSSMTAFRHLKQLEYRCSYNHRGRYYTRHELSRYDRFGLWSDGDIHFSVDGSLRKTVRRMVEEAPAGATHQELQTRLRVRVHNTLLDLLRKGEVERERLLQVYVYLHMDTHVRTAQLQRRRELVSREKSAGAEGHVELDDALVIHVLLTLLRHREAKPGEVVRYLRGHLPAIGIASVRAVFERYDLDSPGEKGGTSSC